MDVTTERLTFRERGFPYSTFPTGWFQVGWSDELAVGDVVPLRFFGRDLVLFRTRSGAATILDGTCAHMGAALAFGGVVEDECLRCPFHAWLWGADGGLVEVPYSERTPGASLRVWPTREASGVVYVWHDHIGGEPTWEPPVVAEDADPGFHRGFPHGARRERVWLHPHFVAENFPDMVHMKYVHKWLDIPAPDVMEMDGPVARNSFEGRIATPRGPVTVRNEGFSYGLGLNIARITGTVGSCTLGAFTPIDDRSSMAFVTVWVPKASDDEERPTGLAAAMIRANHDQLFGDEYDRPIFEHLRYTERPLLLPEESAQRAFRRWAHQFYPAEPSTAGTTGPLPRSAVSPPASGSTG